MTGWLLAAVCALTPGASPVYAYYDLPGVQIAPSQGSVSLTSGQAQTIGVQIAPSQEDQLPGCGMPECPQTCPPECIGAGGWCTCAGASFVTYYTQVSAVSSNSSVAQASYAGGALTVTGVSPGSATITIYASLAKHRDSSASVSVTVAAPAVTPPTTKPPAEKPPGTDSSSSSSKSSESSSSSSTESGTESSSSAGTGAVASGSGSGASVDAGKTPVGAEPGSASGQTGKSAATGSGSGAGAGAGQTGAGQTSGAARTSEDAGRAPAEPSVLRMSGRDGLDYTVVTLGLGADIPGVLSEAAGRKEKVVVQQKDASGNVAYSLSFLGDGLSAPDASAFSGSLTGRIDDELSKDFIVSGDAMALRFDDHVALPGKAEVYVAAGRHFTEAGAEAGGIDVYQIDPATGEVLKIAQGGSVVNGYIIFDLDNTNDVVLASGALAAPGLEAGVAPAQGGGLSPILWVAIAAVCAIALAAILLYKHRRAKGARSDD